MSIVIKLLILSVFTISASWALLPVDSFDKKISSFKMPATKDIDKLNNKSNVSFRGQKSGRSIQYHNGVPVFGTEILEEYKNGKLIYQTGHFAELKNSINVVPTLSPNEALIEASKIKSLSNWEIPKLEIFPMEKESKLIWHLTEIAFDSVLELFIDAHSGVLLGSFNSLTSGSGVGMDEESKEFETTFDSEKNLYILRTEDQMISTYDAENGTSLPGKIFQDDDDFWTDPAGVDAHYYMSSFATVLKDRFGRNSFDNDGAKIMSTVHYKENYVNAFWNRRQLVFGDGDGESATALSGALDVVAHELTHAVTTYTSNLYYYNQSGALNEAFSDIMAAYAEYILQPDKFDWMIGEDVWTPNTPDDALRYMNNPTQDGRSRDFYFQRYTGPNDNGGVHINSGIANLAFQLLVDGGIHPREPSPTVIGIGMEKAISIFYEAFTTKLTRYSKFKDAKKACIEVAKKYGEDVEQSVLDAWVAVGVRPLNTN